MKNKTVKFQFGRGKNGQWYWRFRAANGEIIAQGEGYKQRRSAVKIMEILANAFARGEIMEQELDASGKPIPGPKYLGTLVTAKKG